MFRILILSLALLIPTIAPAQSGDPVTGFSTQDTQMNDAMAQARTTLQVFLDNVTDTEGYSFGNTSVKVAFDTSEGAEIIWVGPLQWDKNTDLTGVLRNQPNYMEGLNAGDQVQFTLDMVRDWSFISDDGTMFGNYTTRVMVPMLDANTAASLNAALSPDPVPPQWK